MPFRVKEIQMPPEAPSEPYGSVKTGVISGKADSTVRDRYFLASRHLIGFGGDGTEPSSSVPEGTPETPTKEEQEFKNKVDQSVEYYRKKKFERAYHVFLNLAKTETGQKDWKTQYYLAKVALDLFELKTAFSAAKLAAEVGKSKLELDKGTLLLKILNSLFGPVTFLKSGEQKSEETRGYLSIVAINFVNKKKKEAHQKLVDYLNKTPLSFPTTLYLPFGDYVVNGVPVSFTKESQNPEFPVFIDPLPEDFTYLGTIAIGAGMLVLIFGGLATQGKQTFDTGGE